ncbi:MAG: hypothetical protein ACRD3A_09875, partial [Terriglobales bacterium]
MSHSLAVSLSRRALAMLVLVAVLALTSAAFAQAAAPARQPQAAKHEAGGEASLKLPDLSTVTFLG